MPSIPSPRGRNTGGGPGGLVCLVDVNNFYASCERVFDPGLEGRPVVVLSNNDGCIIARSQEAKDLGIPMGEPVHKVKDFLCRERVHVYSSNYALYGDMSARVVAVLKRFTPYLEVYSIDESFLDLTGFADPAAHGRAVKDAVHRWTGLPVSVGTGATKTLAKIANRTAKKDPGLGGVFVMPPDPGDNDALLAALPADAVWGIGRRLAQRLGKLGVVTALDLKRAEPKFIRSRLGVVVERTVLELRGIPCLDLELTQPDHKGIMVARGFGRRITEYRHIAEAVATYVSRAAEKLRRQDLAANTLTVSLRTSPFDTHRQRYANAAGLTFPEATFDTPAMIAAAGQCLKRIYRPGLAYQKAGVFLDGLEKVGAMQLGLFASIDQNRADALMRAVDRLNRDWGRDTVRFAAAGTRRPWMMKQKMRSPCYTTRWQDLKRVGN